MKKYLKVILTVCLIISLVGCNKDNSHETLNESDNVSSGEIVSENKTPIIEVNENEKYKLAEGYVLNSDMLQEIEYDFLNNDNLENTAYSFISDGVSVNVGKIENRRKF